MNSLLAILSLAVVIGLSQGAPQTHEARVEVVEAVPTVVDEGTVTTALAEGDTLPWTEFFSETYNSLFNGFVKTMTSLDLPNTMDFNYEKTLERLQAASIDMAFTPMMTAVSTLREVVVPYTIGFFKSLYQPYYTLVVYPVNLYLAVLLPAFGLIFGVVYAGYSVVSLAFNTKARVWGMTRDFIEEGMNVFSGDALQDGVQEISRRAFNAIDKMSRKYE